ncbi:L,D-transpeptidase family protein [Rufibacter roseus]|uniref:Murein L,D-transpeptidase n=1 Tax=Rufibacter roseus TaxID=1567108 RepID=A0ABW2DK70_9BACT|nr:L,D-transpeptidase family protein [Rufibacter roseus]
MKQHWRVLFALIYILFFSGAAKAQPAVFSPARQVELLRQAQQQYQNIARSGKWKSIDQNVCLVACEKAAEVTGLKNNLQLTGDLPSTVSEQDSLFDDVLKEAVKKFQRRHGLTPDGVVGPQTLEALNVPPDQRLAQITLNLQRWQQASTQPSQRMVFVNLPDFKLYLLDSSGQSIWQTRVIIGRTEKQHQTIPMDSLITYLVLNPTWTVPQSILRREIIPMVKTDPNYLSRNNMVVYRAEGTKKHQVTGSELLSNPKEVAQGKYWVVQQPGPKNSLGKIKFMFPNQHDIYLHDTPERSLFNHPVRAYSHGCVRVENPEMLGTYLLQKDWATVRTTAPELQQNAPNQTIILPTPVTVKLAYYTAWVDQTGQLQFRNDIYQLDKLSSLQVSTKK